MSEVTHILNAIAVGDPRAAAQLLPLVYDELRRLAAARMALEKPGQTLDATALGERQILIYLPLGWSGRIRMSYLGSVGERLSRFSYGFIAERVSRIPSG